MRAVAAAYGKAEALKDVSLSVHAGEIVALVGPNGAGKTTTLRTVSGLVRPTRGEVILMGQSVQRLAPHRVVEMGVAHVPEARHLFPDMTVRENLEVGAGNASHSVVMERMERVMDLFPRVRERLNQMAGTLSGGEQQMVAIGRGLMSGPKMMLLDEPSLGLAPQVVQQIGAMIGKLAETGVTILLVEQNAHMALRISHRAYVLETGEVTLGGPAQELLNDEHVRQAYLGG